jgi:hypothetical protein
MLEAGRQGQLLLFPRLFQEELGMRAVEASFDLLEV